MTATFSSAVMVLRENAGGLAAQLAQRLHERRGLSHEKILQVVGFNDRVQREARYIGQIGDEV